MRAHSTRGAAQGSGWQGHQLEAYESGALPEGFGKVERAEEAREANSDSPSFPYVGSAALSVRLSNSACAHAVHAHSDYNSREAQKKNLNGYSYLAKQH